MKHWLTQIMSTWTDLSKWCLSNNNLFGISLVNHSFRFILSVRVWTDPMHSQELLWTRTRTRTSQIVIDLELLSQQNRRRSRQDRTLKETIQSSKMCHNYFSFQTVNHSVQALTLEKRKEMFSTFTPRWKNKLCEKVSHDSLHHILTHTCSISTILWRCV